MTYSSIFTYFSDSVGTDGNVMNNVKSAMVGSVLLEEVDDNLMYLKANTAPSQKLLVPHH